MPNSIMKKNYRLEMRVWSNMKVICYIFTRTNNLFTTKWLELSPTI